MENIWDHYGNWGAVIVWVIMYGAFLAFVPFYKKSQRKPASVYLAFVVAFALEMFGIPMSMYFVTWVFGKQLPEGVLWGHTLQGYIGYTGMYIMLALCLVGAVLVISGWSRIHKRYWSRPDGEGQLVRDGVYAYIRHPQYTGFLLITLGLLIEWATLPLLLMWPTLVIMYYRLARMEENEVEAKFGQAYRDYRSSTGMFFPRFFVRRDK